MSLPTQTKQWQLSHKPTTAPVLKGDDATYKFVTKEVPELKDGEVLGQALYLSNDPTQRYERVSRPRYRVLIVPKGMDSRTGRPRADVCASRSYRGGHESMLRSVQRFRSVLTSCKAMGVMKVIESKSDKFAKGSLVTGPAGWTEYTVLPANRLQQVPEVSGISPTHFLGALGPTGLTAWYGLVSISLVWRPRSLPNDSPRSKSSAPKRAKPWWSVAPPVPQAPWSCRSLSTWSAAAK